MKKETNKIAQSGELQNVHKIKTMDDIIPFDWDMDVINGSKKVIVSMKK